jgi:very-short-patch-repair endonuclease
MSDNKIPFEKSFASHEKAKYWSDKNELKPENIVNNLSNKKYWFICNDCKHNFDISLYHLTNRNQWCPYCANKKLCDNFNCNICFDKSFASHEKSKYWNNTTILPRQIFKSNGHKYIHNCYKTSKKLCGINECNICFEKSFASHEKAKYWSDKNELKPINVFRGSQEQYLFNCYECGHEINNNPNAITSNNQWCSYCANKKLCENNNCKICFDKSFACHEKSKYWSNKNDLTPIQVFKGSNNYYLFECNTCNHTFDQQLYHVSNNNVWCNYCSNRKLCENINCKICFDKSFASHEKSKYWSNDNKLKPRDVFKNSKTKYIFKCELCNIPFTMELNCVNYSQWCGCKKNKTETKLLLKMIDYVNIIKGFRINWCKNSNGHILPYDFCIEENKIIIELDGAQHFRQVRNWKSPEEQLENDKYKQKCANENSYSVIRLLQEDVLYDKYDWKTELINNIEKIKTDNIIQNIYMYKNNEYKNFIN